MAKKKPQKMPAKPAINKPSKEQAGSVLPKPEPRKNADFENAVDAELKNQPPRNWGGSRDGSGRPQKPEAQPAAAAYDFDSMKAPIKGLFGLPFDIWAFKTGLSELELSDFEAELLADPTIILLKHFLPEILTEVHIAALSLVMAAAYLTKEKSKIARSKIPPKQAEPSVPLAGQQSYPRTPSRPAPPVNPENFPSYEEIRKNERNRGIQ